MCDRLSHYYTVPLQLWRTLGSSCVSSHILRELSFSIWLFLLDRPAFIKALKSDKNIALTFYSHSHMNGCLLFLVCSINHTVSPNQQNKLHQCFSVWPSITILTPCWCFPSSLLLDQMVPALASLLSFFLTKLFYPKILVETLPCGSHNSLNLPLTHIGSSSCLAWTLSLSLPG